MHFIESNMPSVLRSIFQGESFHNVYVYLVYFKYLIVLFVNYISKKIFFKEASKRETKKDGESPGGPVVRTLCFHCRGHEFHLWLEDPHMLCGAAKKKQKTNTKTKGREKKLPDKLTCQ